PLGQARQRQGGAADRYFGRADLPRAHPGERVHALHDGARPRLGRLSRGARARGPGRAARRLPHLPMGDPRSQRDRRHPAAAAAAVSPLGRPEASTRQYRTGHNSRQISPGPDTMPLSNLAIRDIETLAHPNTNLAQLRETGPLVIERGKGIYVYDT